MGRVRDMEVIIKKLSTASNGSEKDDEDAPPPGFRFHPTDEELVGFYLKRKVEKKPLRIELIKHVDVYKHEPWELPREVSNYGGEREWYFFCRRGRKYKNSIRPNRVTGSGFWKATGIDKPIYSVGKLHHCIGLKKSLVYYRGSAGKGTKTDWMMHEFRLPEDSKTSTLVPHLRMNQEAEVWTLCRIFKREVSYRKYASDCQKFATKGSLSDSSSETSLSRIDERHKQESYGFSLGEDKVVMVEKKPVINNDHCHGSNDHLFEAQLSLTAQVPIMASYLSFNNGDDSFDDGNWDELRPMVDFALDDRSMLYSVR